MFTQFHKYYVFLAVAFIACNSTGNKKKAEPLLTLLTTDERSENVKLEFTTSNSIHFKNTKPYLNEIPDYILSKFEIAKRDSFIHIMLSNNRRESYIDMESCFEQHNYTISINSAATNKEVQIVGHNAPKKYYDFVSWALALKTNRQAAN